MATPIKPASGEVIPSTSGSASVTFEWAERTNQVAYRLRYKLVDDANWTMVEETSSATSKTVTLTEGDYIWSAQVKYGAFTQSWEPWYSESTFSVYDRPTVTITAPANNSTVTAWPMQYTATFSDSNGTFADGELSLYNTSNDLVYTERLASSLTGYITTNEYMPTNGTYRMRVLCNSSTTLANYAYSDFTVNIPGTDQGTLTIANDTQTGYATLTVGWDNSGAVHANRAATLYRIVDGERVLVKDYVQRNETLVDKFAPLNKTYQYEVVTYAEPTAVTSKTFTNKITTDRWFAIWDGGAKSAWAEWNPTGSYKLTRPQKKRVHYVGREYPVSYDGTALDETHNITFTVVDMDSWSNGFIELMHDGGRGVYKSVDGKVFWADFEITNTPKYTSITRIGTVNLEITRIDGDAV